MKINRIETPEDYMISLDWDHSILERCKTTLLDLDKRDENGYYKSLSKMTVKVDKANREHLRNCIEFWEKRLNENK